MKLNWETFGGHHLRGDVCPEGEGSPFRLSQTIGRNASLLCIAIGRLFIAKLVRTFCEKT